MKCPEIIKEAVFLPFGKKMKGFGGVLKTNPKSDEINKATALYEKTTGKNKKDMTFIDINSYVLKIRGPKPKKSPGAFTQAKQELKDPRFKSNIKGFFAGKSKAERIAAHKNLK